MRNKTLLITAVLTLQIILVGSVFAEIEWNEPKFSGKAFQCSIAGLWEAPIGLATVVPLDATGKRFSITFDAPTHPIGEILGPGVKFSSLARGVINKIGANLYDFSLRRFVILNTSSPTVLKTRGLTKFLDCNTRVYTCKTTVFDAGGNELYCISTSGHLFRMEPQEPCDGFLPDFPE